MTPDPGLALRASPWAVTWRAFSPEHRQCFRPQSWPSWGAESPRCDSLGKPAAIPLRPVGPELPLHRRASVTVLVARRSAVIDRHYIWATKKADVAVRLRMFP